VAVKIPGNLQLFRTHSSGTFLVFPMMCRHSQADASFCPPLLPCFSPPIPHETSVGTPMCPGTLTNSFDRVIMYVRVLPLPPFKFPCDPRTSPDAPKICVSPSKIIRLPGVQVCHPCRASSCLIGHCRNYLAPTPFRVSAKQSPRLHHSLVLCSCRPRPPAYRSGHNKPPVQPFNQQAWRSIALFFFPLVRFRCVQYSPHSCFVETRQLTPPWRVIEEEQTRHVALFCLELHFFVSPPSERPCRRFDCRHGRVCPISADVSFFSAFPGLDLHDNDLKLL